MRDLSPSPLDMTYAVLASNATMPRKSSASPSATCRRCQVLPSSSDFRITPFEPEAQTTTTGALFSSGLMAMLMPRKLVSMPLVCTFHQCASAGSLKRSESTKTSSEYHLAGIVNLFVVPRRQVLEYLSALHDEGHATNG